MLRKVELVKVGNKDSKYSKIVKIHSEGVGDIICWRGGSRKCMSDCAAWDIFDSTRIVRCKALPDKDQGIAIIIKGK